MTHRTIIYYNKVKKYTFVEHNGSMKKIKLALILPCFNEQEVLEHSFDRLQVKYHELVEKGIISADSKIAFVDDGSRDKTWDIIASLSNKHANIIGVKLSRNFGHQNALLAGFDALINQFDCYITLDIDLQDDIETINAMLEKYYQGASIVYGVRDNRDSDSFFKRFTAELFYKVMNKIGIHTIFNHADYRLTDNAVLNEFSQFREGNVFLRGLFPLVGFKHDIVYYKRMERFAGETKYPFMKMLKFAWTGITSFSAFPMTLILWLGILLFCCSIVVGIFSFYIKMTGQTTPGWASLVLLISSISGIQMISLGLIGEYVGKIYMELKNRPRFIIEKTINNDLK